MDRIKVSVVGAGRWGPNLIRNFYSQKNSFVVAVADQSTSRLKLLQERYPEIKVTQSADDVLSDPATDAVVICTPTESHFELTRKALLHNKHVFVEKPLARTTEECSELIELARKQDRVLFVGHVFVYNAGIQAIHKYIHSGELGNLHYIQISRTNLGPIRSDVSALWDLAPHDLSILHYWLDEMPVRVSATGGRYLSQNLDDAVFATYTFRNNVMANLHVSWLNPKKVREIVVVGEKKMLVWNDLNLDNPVVLYDKTVKIDPAAHALVDTFVGFRTTVFEGDTLIPKIQLNEPLQAECAAFLKAIQDPSSSLSTGEHGRAVVEVLEATERSLAQRGGEVQIGTL